MAQWNGEDRVHVWTHSQGVYLLRNDLALVLKLPLEHITVEHLEGAGCYGHNPADDVALDAALLAKAAPGRPVRVQWSRADEMTHGPFGAAMAIEIEADLDAQRRDRRMAAFDLEQWPRRAAGPRHQADAACRLRARTPVSDRDLGQSAAGQWRRRRPQLDSALRFPGVEDRKPSPAHHAGAHLGAADAGRAGQCVCDRVLPRRDRGRARRGSGRVSPAASEGRARQRP